MATSVENPEYQWKPEMVILRHESQKMDDVAIGYLAGVIDGEGSITLNHLVRANGTHKIMARIDITNTSMRLLKQCAETIEDITQRPCTIRLTDGRGNRPVFRISIQDRESVNRLLDCLGHLLIAKGEQAAIIKRFHGIKKVRGAWDEAQAILKDEIYRLNKFGN